MTKPRDTCPCCDGKRVIFSAMLGCLRPCSRCDPKAFDQWWFRNRLTDDERAARRRYQMTVAKGSKKA